MNELSFQEQLTRILDAQIRLSGELLSLLKQEYEVLNGTNVESLTELANQKKPIVVDMENLSRAWEVLLKNKGVELSAKGIERFLQEFDAVNNTQLQTAWSSLQDKARECQKKNIVNGSVIAMRNQTTQQAIAVLRGRKPEERLYNHYGAESSTYAGGNSLAKA